MRKAYGKTAAVVIAIAVSFSGMAVAEPLAPGKPAGVQSAQMTMGNKEWLVFGGLTVLVAAILIANNGSGEHTPVVSPPVTVTGPGSP